MLELELLKGCWQRVGEIYFKEYKFLIDGFARMGFMESAKKLYDEMVEKGIIPDETTHSSLTWGFCGEN